MSGFFGISSKHECMQDVFFGVDFHSHLGTRRAGLSAYDKDLGFQREIHNIENSPFRTKFDKTINVYLLSLLKNEIKKIDFLLEWDGCYKK